MKKVVVIIVTYNGSRWIEKNIKSLINSNYPIDIIVIDNLSEDNTVSILESFNNVQIIKNNCNSGFGMANNIGIEIALEKNADYVFLLNQDTWIFEDTIKILVEIAENNPTFGIVSPIHYSGDSKTLDGKFKTYYEKKIEIKTNIDVSLVPFVNAAAWLISRSCLQKVGRFEPLFSHYGEDNDFCRRVIFHKFQIAIAENSKICHDRIIIRSFKKDVLQSKLQILFEVLNINNDLIKCYFLGFKSIFGSVKYYSKFYSFSQISKLFYILLIEYIVLLFSIVKMKKARDIKIV